MLAACYLTELVCDVTVAKSIDSNAELEFTGLSTGIRPRFRSDGNTFGCRVTIPNQSIPAGGNGRATIEIVSFIPLSVQSGKEFELYADSTTILASGRVVNVIQNRYVEFDK